MKKILVPIKRVPDWQIKLKIAADGKSIDPSNLKWIINTFDEIAVEEAVRLKEKHQNTFEVVLLCVGPEAATEQIRSALAIGADSAIHVTTDDLLDSECAAKIIANIYKKYSFDIILLGKQAIDSDSGQVAGRLAQILDLPQAAFASKIEIDEKIEKAVVVREIDGGLETVEVMLPAVISTDLRLNEPRLRSLPSIVAAKKKPIETLPFSSIAEGESSRCTIEALEYPKKRAAGKKVGSVEELVSCLRDEAKII